MTWQPDTKDWTWVLERPCPDCGYDGARLPRERFGDALRANASAWPELLSQPGAGVRSRPDRWSTLEYGAHVRDVFRVFSTRLDLMISQEDPRFENWDQDATALADRYDLQDPHQVAADLVAAGAALADAYDAVGPSQWPRTGTRSNGSRFTVETLGRYLVHDPVHHLWDVSGVRFTLP